MLTDEQALDRIQQLERQLKKDDYRMANRLYRCRLAVDSLATCRRGYGNPIVSPREAHKLLQWLEHYPVAPPPAVG